MARRKKVPTKTHPATLLPRSRCCASTSSEDKKIVLGQNLSYSTVLVELAAPIKGVAPAVGSGAYISTVKVYLDFVTPAADRVSSSEVTWGRRRQNGANKLCLWHEAYGAI